MDVHVAYNSGLSEMLPENTLHYGRTSGACRSALMRGKICLLSGRIILSYVL